MSRKPLLVCLVLVLIVGVLAWNRLKSSDSETVESSTEADAVPAADLQTAATPEAVAIKLTTLDDLGAPDDALPSPLPLLATGEPVQSDQGAEVLARQVLDGGPDFLQALVTALQASGVGVIGPGNAEVLKPAEPWQGIVMQRWEVRTAAAMVLPSRSVIFTLADVSAFLVAAIPELKGAPLDQFIVTDIRALAESPVPTRRFLGRFIVALGRNATSHQPYDLLGDVNPQTFQFDGLQVSLIVRRLAADIAALANSKQSPATKVEKKSASIVGSVHEWIEPTLYAQEGSPCRLSESNQNTADNVAFGSSMAWGGFGVGEMGTPSIMGWLTSRYPNLSNLGRYAAIVSTLLQYAQFIATYAALDADVSIDHAPLERTKKMSPQTGERRELTAIVKFNVGNAQMLNCFRALLIPIGLDFNLPNNGPIKGAHVGWYGVQGFDQAAAALHGGDEAIVQFVAPEAGRVQGGGDASSGQNAVTNQVTGEDGKVHIGVEGRGQSVMLTNKATPVTKSAKVRLQVALKGADLFGDLQEAASTAAGGLIGLATLPLSILTRAQWASTGHFSFPVKDWREGPGKWLGTITIVETNISSESGQAFRGGHKSQETETERIDIELVDTVSDFITPTGIVSMVKGKVTGVFDRQKTFAGYTIDSCGATKNRTMNNTSTEHWHGSNDGEATVSVSVQDGTYIVSAISEMQIEVTGTFVGSIDTFGQGCAASAKASSHDIVPFMSGVGGGINAGGVVDPRNPNVLAGSTTEDQSPTGSGGSSTRRAKTTTWNIRRQ